MRKATIQESLAVILEFHGERLAKTGANNEERRNSEKPGAIARRKQLQQRKSTWLEVWTAHSHSDYIPLWPKSVSVSLHVREYS